MLDRKKLDDLKANPPPLRGLIASLGFSRCPCVIGLVMDIDGKGLRPCLQCHGTGFMRNVNEAGEALQIISSMAKKSPI